MIGRCPSMVGMVIGMGCMMSRSIGIGIELDWMDVSLEAFDVYACEACAPTLTSSNHSTVTKHIVLLDSRAIHSRVGWANEKKTI